MKKIYSTKLIDIFYYLNMSNKIRNPFAIASKGKKAGKIKSKKDKRKKHKKKNFEDEY